jgi:hypothetical protein
MTLKGNFVKKVFEYGTGHPSWVTMAENGIFE